MAGALWILAIFSLMIGLAFPVLLAGAAFFGALALIVSILQALGLFGSKPEARTCPHCDQPVTAETATCPNCRREVDAGA